MVTHKELMQSNGVVSASEIPNGADTPVDTDVITANSVNTVSSNNTDAHLFGWCFPGQEEHYHDNCREEYDFYGRTVRCSCKTHGTQGNPVSLNSVVEKLPAKPAQRVQRKPRTSRRAASK